MTAVPPRLATALAATLATCVLLCPSAVPVHALRWQAPASSPASDAARARRDRQEKARSFQREATAMLRRSAAASPGSADRTQLLAGAATQIDALVTEASSAPALLPDDLRNELRKAATDLRQMPPSIEPFIA